MPQRIGQAAKKHKKESLATKRHKGHKKKNLLNKRILALIRSFHNPF
jgi:hypothetical protein